MPTLIDTLIVQDGGGRSYTASQLGAAIDGQDSATLDLKGRGFITFTGPPWGTGVGTMTSQSEIALKLWLPQKTNVITGAAVNLSTAGGTLTSGQNLITLYNSAGTLIGQSADQTAAWGGATGNKYAAFASGPFTLTGGPGAYCYCSLLSNGTTPASFRTVGQNQAWYVVGPGADLTGVALPVGRVGSAVTAPASFTPANLVQTTTLPYWIGLY